MADLTGVVGVEGLRELRRDLRRMDADLARGVREVIKDAAGIVAQEAARRAPRSHDPRGRHMADTIRPRARGDVGLVIATAKRRSAGWPAGFPYPRRIEYGRGGSRAFLRPALAAKSREVEERMARLVDDLADRYWED